MTSSVVGTVTILGLRRSFLASRGRYRRLLLLFTGDDRTSLASPLVVYRRREDVLGFFLCCRRLGKVEVICV